jgi:hypothetical protein
MVPTLVKLEFATLLASEVPDNVSALAVPMFALTKAVVANCVELSLVVGVGAVGVPVNEGEAKGALVARAVLIVAMSDVLLIMFVVFDAILVGNVAIMAELTPPTLFTVLAKLPVPVPETSPVNVMV